MDIYNEPEGSKLMWDASPAVYLIGDKMGQPIIYPVVIGRREKSPRWRKVHTSRNNAQWMQDPCQYIRRPTEEETKTLQWPEI